MEVKSIIGVVLVKKYMLLYVQDVRAVREMERGLSYHHVVLCKVRLVEPWIKMIQVMVGARRIIREKLWEYQYREGYGEESKIGWR